MEFTELAKFPMRDEDDWIMTVLIGGVLVFLGFLIVPLLIVMGYMVAVMRGAVAGDAEPPQFGDWGGMAVDGLKALVITLVYQIVPLLFFLVFGVGSILALLSGTESGAGIGVVGLLGTMAVFTVLSIVFGYVGMIGVVNFAVEDSIGAGFDFGTIASVATSGAWLKAWAFYIAVSLVAGIVGSVTGGLGSPFASFYALSVGGRTFGEAFADVTGAGAAPGRTATPTTA